MPADVSAQHRECAGLSGNVYSVPDHLQQVGGSVACWQPDSMHAWQGSVATIGSAQPPRPDAEALLGSQHAVTTAAVAHAPYSTPPQNGVEVCAVPGASTNKQVCTPAQDRVV